MWTVYKGEKRPTIEVGDGTREKDALSAKYSKWESLQDSDEDDGADAGASPTSAATAIKDGNAAFEAMQREGIIVRPLAPYGMSQWIRVSVGTEEHNELAIKALTSFLSR